MPSNFVVRLLPLAIAVLAVGASPPARAADLPDLDGLWNYADPAATETRLREVLPVALASGNGEYVAELWTQIARTQSLRGRFDDAHGTLDRVEKTMRPEWKTAPVRALLERGRAFNSAGRKDEARPVFLRAWERSTASGLDEHACDAAHMLGIVETGEAGIEWTAKALALAESSKHPKANRWVGSLCQNLGYALQERGEHEKALGVFRKGLAWSIERKRAAPARVFRWFIGKSQRLSGDIEGGLATQRALRAEAESEGTKDGFVSEEIAEGLVAQGKTAEAKPYFAEAYALLKDAPELVSAPERLERLRTLGGVPPPK
jgi:tetratricopeptide (TPR) repeat protein